MTPAEKQQFRATVFQNMAAEEAKARKERNKAMGLKLLEKRKCSPSS